MEVVKESEEEEEEVRKGVKEVEGGRVVVQGERRGPVALNSFSRNLLLPPKSPGK